MSTENSSDQLFNNSVKILTDLISFKTISGEDNSSLINYCDEILNKLGATSFKTFDDEKKRVNLFATLKAKKPSNKKPIILSGHTDVVPVSKGWSTDPFVATIKDDKLFGRGSCDMKGFIACTLAFAPIYAKANLDRDIHFSYTFDEETACIGAPILIEELKKRGVKDGICIIGEPTNMKIIDAHKGCYEYTTYFEGLGSFGAFLAVFSIMVGYFAAVVINFGDFARFVKNEDEMRKGNLWGLVGNVILFSFITLMITGGTIAIFGEYVASPTEMVAKVDNLGLTIIAAFAFFAATVGINMVANFIPPAYDLANLMPDKINFKTGGLITAGFGFIIGGMWVAVITQMGLFPFVNTLGAILAPVFGIMIVDYYIIKKEKLDVDALFDASPSGKYHYNGGFNHKGMLAWILSGYIAVGTVWPNILVFGLDDFFANLGGGGGYAWIIGASLGAVVHLAISKR